MIETTFEKFTPKMFCYRLQRNKKLSNKTFISNLSRTVETRKILVIMMNMNTFVRANSSKVFKTYIFLS